MVIILFMFPLLQGRGSQQLGLQDRGTHQLLGCVVHGGDKLLSPTGS